MNRDEEGVLVGPISSNKLNGRVGILPIFFGDLFLAAAADVRVLGPKSFPNDLKDIVWERFSVPVIRILEKWPGYGHQRPTEFSWSGTEDTRELSRRIANRWNLRSGSQDHLFRPRILGSQLVALRVGLTF